jgi:hypothetical protein
MEYAAMMRGIKLVVVSCLMLFASGRAEADLIYVSGAVDAGLYGQLETFNTANNAVNTVGSAQFLGVLSDIGFTASGSTLYGIGVSDPTLLFSVATSGGSSGSLTYVANTGVGLNALGGTPSSDTTMYASGGDQIYTVTTSGTALALSNTMNGSNGTTYQSAGDITYFEGAVYATVTDGFGNDLLVTINTSTGVATRVGTGNLGSSLDFGLAAVGTTLYAFAGSDVYTVNTTTGSATQLGANNILGVGFLVTGAAAVPDTTPGVVPEPSSLILCGVAGIMGLGYYRRRGKRNAA